jgi:hypothetical protein
LGAHFLDVTDIFLILRYGNYLTGTGVEGRERDWMIFGENKLCKMNKRNIKKMLLYKVYANISHIQLLAAIKKTMKRIFGLLLLFYLLIGCKEKPVDKYEDLFCCD